MMTDGTNADAWSLPGVLDFFGRERRTTEQVYPSEWFFLKDLLCEGISVLDVGCAQGGFAGILGEHLKTFSYTGIDISAAMVGRARQLHPGHEFLQVGEADFSPLDGRRFDLVLVLGILHLHEAWRETLRGAWRHTAGALLLDLRETDAGTIEDRNASKFRMIFGAKDSQHEQAVLPYIVINSGEALSTVRSCCPEASGIAQFGYLHPASEAAETPVRDIVTKVYCVKR